MVLAIPTFGRGHAAMGAKCRVRMVVSTTLEILNVKGLHARASAKFAALAGTFESIIRVSKDNQKVDATSIMGLLLLAAARGSEIHLEAEGADAEEALTALSALVNRKFDEAA